MPFNPNPFLAMMQIPMFYLQTAAKIGQVVFEANMKVAETMRENLIPPKKAAAT